MSEDLRKRLEFRNRGVRNAAIEKIKSQIIKGLAKAKTEGLGESLTKKIPELELLWDQCHVKSADVSHACCNALASLVLTLHLDLDEVLRGFLNFYPSASNVSGIAKGIMDLLVIQTRSIVQGQRSNQSVYRNPYKIRSHPHPLITCLMSRPNTWPVILHQVQNLFSLSDKSIQPYIIPMLQPFLKYLFLEPGQSIEYASLRAALYSSLLQQCSVKTPHNQGIFHQTIINFFLECIPVLQICLPQHIADVTTFIDQFSTILLTSQHDDQRPLCQLLSTYVTALCLHARQSGLDTSHLLTTLHKLTEGNPLPQSAMVLIGWLILEANSLKELSILLKFVEEILSQSEKPQVSNPISLFLVFPLVQIIASPPLSSSVNGDQLARIQKKATYCLSLIQRSQSEARNYGMGSSKCEVTAQCQSGISLCPSYVDIKTYTNLLLHLHGNKMAVPEWLAVIQSKFISMKSVSDHVMMVVASLLMRRDEDQIDGCLGTLLAIARMDPSKAPGVLTLLLYLLGVEDRPLITMKVLNAIPQTATHRYCISPVLKVIQSLGTVRDMFAVSMRLLTVLWKLQDRCFPHLQKMLTIEKCQESQCKPFEYNEELLAKAASIKDICVARPFQHGADLVHLLSTFLNDYTERHHAIPASFALEGLSALCEAEVVDIRSTWGLLAPKLQQDQRTLVQINVCKLFSLIPSLAVDTDEYEEFRSDVVEMLWSLSTNQKAAVAGAAFTALAKFDPEEFTLYDLPEEVTLHVREKLAKLKKDSRVDSEEEDEEDEEDVDVDVPGSCYMQLLLHIDDNVLSDFGYFLTSMIQREVKELPRSVYHPTQLRQANNEKSISKAVATIADVLKNKYNRNKQPGLKAGLAGGLLCCFESIPTVGREGKVERRHLASSGRAYQQMLNTLVNEVPIQASEWFQSLHLPEIWRNFMERAFLAILEGRKAELEIQESHGHRDDEEDDLETAQSIAWLWTRDKLTDILKSCARGNPSAQANSILALASLAFVSSKHANSLGPDAQQNQANAPEHMGQNYWLETVAETVLCMVNNDYKPSKRVFTWCQRSSAKGRQFSSSPIVKSCAALALSTMVPVLTTNYSDLIFKMVECLSSGLPGQHQADDVPMVSLHISLGLGFLLKKLYEERFTDVTDQEGKLKIMRALDQLEELSLSDDVNNDGAGVYLGLMLALVGICHDGSTETRVHLSSMFGKLKARLESKENMENLSQAFLMCVSCVTVSMFAANLTTKDAVMDVVFRMRELQESHPESCLFAFSFGSLIHSLLKADHPQVFEIYNQLCISWFDKFEDKTLCTPERLMAVSGLTTLVSGPSTIVYGVSESSLTSDMNARTTNLVKQLILLMNDNTDITLKGQSAWLLGYIYMATISTTSIASDSTSYNQLPETSVLRSTIDLMIEAGKVGPEGLLPARLEVAMRALWEGSDNVLPPLNWAGVLSPIKRLKFGSPVHVLCLQLALRECVSSPSASLFITAWTSSAMFNSLQLEEKNLLYKSLPILMKTLPLAKLKFFLATNIVKPFTKCVPNTITACEAVLLGLTSALAVPDPPQSVTYLLYQAVENIYHILPRDIKNYQLYQSILLSECICQLPGEVIDSLTSPVADDNLIKSTFIRSHIVSEGKQALVWLNPCIDVAMQSGQTERQLLLWYILSALSRSVSKKSEHISVMSRMTWLLELMGHIHNVARGLNLAEDAVQDPPMSVQFLIEVFAAAVTAWSSTTNITNLSIPMECNRQGDSALNNCCYRSGTMEVFICQELTNQIPASLVTLLTLNPWSQIADKMIDWLVTLLVESGHMMTQKVRDILKESVYSLRHTAPFKKFPIWSKALTSLD